MRNKSFFAIIGVFVLLIASCTPGFEEPESPIEAGREFINAVYMGNFKKANKLIVDDQENRSLLKNIFEKDFRSRGGFEKEALSKASIQILEINAENNGHTEIRFNNAYFSSQSNLRIEQIEDKWRINLAKSRIKNNR